MATRVLLTPWQPGGLIMEVSNPRENEENSSYKPFSKEKPKETSVVQTAPHGKSLETYFDVILQKVNRLDFPIVLNPKTATFDEVAIHALLRQRIAKGTITRNLRYARFMETHPCPVDFRNPSYENFIRHMDYREQIEGSKWGALKHEWQAMRMFLKAYGIPPNTWSYRPPPRCIYNVRSIPYPEQVNEIIHHRYCKDEYENALVQYLLAHNFIVGWRFPSEAAVLKVSDIRIDAFGRKSVKITEPKKHNSTRYINPIEIMTGKNTKSFKNWIDKWRPKAVSQYSEDYLYLKPRTGEPFTDREQLRTFLNRKAYKQIKQIFPEYYNYTSRHFCAVSRLIRTKLQTKHFDIYEVKDWLGHTKIETTMTYLKDAKHYYEQAPYDWIQRAITKKSWWKKHNAKTGETQKTALTD